MSSSGGCTVFVWVANLPKCSIVNRLCSANLEQKQAKADTTVFCLYVYVGIAGDQLSLFKNFGFTLLMLKDKRRVIALLNL